MNGRLPVLAILALACLTLLAAQTAARPPPDPTPSGSPPSRESDPAHEFVRSDQAHLGRAPKNTQDLSKHVSKEFAGSAAKDAAAVIAILKEKPSPFPVYLGNVHAWRFKDESDYRKKVIELASRVRRATGVRVLYYFEERNYSIGPVRVPPGLAADMRALARQATLLMATYASGNLTRERVVERVRHFRDWYHLRLKVPLHAMFIDVDTSQTPAGQYYGSNGNLDNFNRVIGWALDETYDEQFGGFHTMGNTSDAHGTQIAADSTYQALDRAWAALGRAHPNRVFSGIRSR